MLSLKKLLGKEEKFFDLLEAGAEEAKVSVTLFGAALRKLSAGSNPADLPLDEFIQARRKEKRIRDQMTEELSRTFVTPLEREDIEELSFALYRVPKQVEKIAERLSIYPGRIPFAAFERQAQLMTQAAEALVFMVKQLRGGTNVERIRDANGRLQHAEGEADKVMLQLLRELYQGPYDAKELVILQNLFEMVEQAIDRCRNAGNIVVQIVLKHS
ncbi:MAG: DUF47 domain-containing protein [Opitutaceae bacterium]